MVHKKYIRKNGKLHGPYYYESYRDKDGKVKKRYIGTSLPKQEKKVTLHTKKQKTVTSLPRKNSLKQTFFLFAFFSILLISLLSIGILIDNANVTGQVVADNLTTEELQALAQLDLQKETVDQSFNEKTKLTIKTPEKNGRVTSKNKNKRMDFTINGEQVRLYFDLLNYTEFVTELAKESVNETIIINQTTLLPETIEEKNQTQQIINQTNNTLSLNQTNQTPNTTTIETDSNYTNQTITLTNESLSSGSGESSSNDTQTIDSSNESENQDITSPQQTNESEAENQTSSGGGSSDTTQTTPDTSTDTPQTDDTKSGTTTHNIVDDTDSTSTTENSDTSNTPSSSENSNPSETDSSTNSDTPSSSSDASSTSTSNADSQVSSSPSSSSESSSSSSSDPSSSSGSSSSSDSGSSDSGSSDGGGSITGNVIRGIFSFSGNAIKNIVGITAHSIGIDLNQTNNDSNNTISQTTMGEKTIEKTKKEVTVSEEEIKETAKKIEKEKRKAIEENSTIPVENFDIIVEEKPKQNVDYKWGYQTTLNDPHFFAKVDITTNLSVTQINNYQVQIGNKLLSFKDLINEGYTVSIENPPLQITTQDVTIQKDVTTITQTVSEPQSNQNQETKNNSQSNETSESVNTSFTGNIIQGLTGFVAKGTRGLTGLVVQDQSVEVPKATAKNTITIYIERDFTNSSYNVGDTIILDPTLETISYTNITNESYRTDVINEGNFTHLNITDASPYDALLLYYTFDDNTNTAVVYDYTQNNLDGTNDGGTYTSNGKYAGAMDFTQVDDIIRSGGGSLNVSSEVTVMAWVYPREQNVYQSIAGRGWAGGSGFSDDPWTLHVHVASSQIKFLTANSAGSFVAPAVSISLNSWQHVAGTVNSSTVTIYKNGAYGASSSWPGGNILQNAQPFYVGSNLNGTVDEVMIFNRTLTPAEISAIYNNQSARFKATGTQTNKFFDLSSSDAIEVNVENFQRNISTNLSARAGTWEVSQGYNTSYPTLVSLWSLDESPNDETETANGVINGTLTNTTGIFGGAYYFDGTGDSVYTVYAPDPTAYTYAAWVKPDDVTSTGIFVRTSSSGPTAAWSHQMRISSGSKFEHYIYDGGTKQVTGSTTVQAGQWYHVVITAENSGKARLYVNGVEEGTNISIGTLWTGGDRYYIGSNSGNGMGFFNGTIDDVQHFSTALSPNEVRELYIKGLANWQYTQSQNFSDTTPTASFTTPVNATLGLSEITFHSDAQNFYSPLIKQSTANKINVTVNTTNVTDCTTLATPNTVYTLRNNITTTGTCFTIAANNITLDMNGFNITDSSPAASEYGIVSSGYNDSTIKNGKVFDFLRGVYISNGYNWNISNLTIETNINVFATSASGIYLENSMLNNVSSLNLTVINTGDYQVSYGVYFDTSNNNTLKIINASHLRSYSNSGTGIYFGSSDFNNLTNITSLNNSIGIHFSNSDSNRITNYSSQSERSYGIQLSQSNSNTVNDFLINNSSSHSFYLRGNNSLIQNGHIDYINDVSYNGLYLLEGNNNFFKDIILENIPGTSVSLVTSGSTNNTFLNVSYVNETVSSNSQLLRKWYYQTYVNWTNGTLVSGASVTAVNASGTSMFSTTTNSSGWIQNQVLTAYINNGGTITDTNNYTINASAGIAKEINSVNMSLEQNFKDTHTLNTSEVWNCGTLDTASQNYYLKNNIDGISGTCFTLAADDISFDLNDYTVSGNDDDFATDYGIYIGSGRSGINVGNGTITDFGVGIGIASAFSNTFDNLNVNSNFDGDVSGYGFLLTSATLSNFTNIVANANSDFSISLASSSNSNNFENITLNNNPNTAIQISSSNSNVFTNVSGTSNNVVLTMSSSDQNTFDHFNFSDTTYQALSISSGSDSNNFSTFNLSNCAQLTSTTECILISESDTNTFSSGKISDVTYGGIELASFGATGTDNADDNLFKDIILSSVSGTHVILSDGSGSTNTNNSFLNVTYTTETVGSGSELFRKWYYQAYVNDTQGNLLSSIPVTAYNVSNNLITTLTTNASGWTPKGSLIDYANIGGTKQYYDNYTIYATSGNSYDTNINNYSNKNNLNDVLTIDLLTPFIGFIGPTKANNERSQEPYDINLSLRDLETGIGEVIYNWNGTNYTIFNDSVIAMYNFDNRSSLDESSSLVVDVSGNGYNGTVNNAVFNATGKYGGAYSFNHESHHIDFNDVMDMHYDDMTMSAWIKPFYSGYTGSIVGKGYSITSTGLKLYISTNDKVYAQLADNAGGNDVVIVSDNTVPIQGWTHVAVVADRDGFMTLYINGEPQSAPGDISSFVALDLDNGYDFEIGGLNYPTRNNTFNGSIDEAIIFNRTLNAAEINQLYMTNLYKFNSTQWYLYVNQSANSSAPIAEGDYTYQAFTKDAANNSNQTETRTITIDYSRSIPKFISPTNASGALTRDTSYEVNVSIQEQYLQDVVYHWDGTNFSLLNDSVIAMYNFDNRSTLGENDSLVVDVSGNGYNGTVTNALVNTSGKYHGAYSFDGNGDNIDLGNYTALNPPQLTVSLWAKLHYLDSGTQTLISNSRDCCGTYNGYQIDFNGASQRLRFINWNGTSSALASSIYMNDLGTSQWHHIAVTYDGATKRIYLDGILNQSGSTSLGIGTEPSFELQVGEMGYSNDVWEFNGSIDEVVILNRSLSASEINQLYMTNLYKFNATQWYLYVNQTTNATAGLEDATYTYQVFVNDTANNDNSTESRTITIDTTAPIITNINASNETGVLADTTSGGTVTRNDTVTINATVTGSPQAVWVKIWEGAIGTSTVLFQGLLSLISGDLWGIIVQTNFSFPVGTINYTIFANDSVGNVATNVSGNFTIVESVSVEGCRDLDQANTAYTLQNDITGVVGTCFTITADNITLDLNSNNISGDGSGFDFGVSIDGYNNLTIINGLITGFYYGVNIDTSNQNTITNINVNNNQLFGFKIDTSDNNNFTNIISSNENSGLDFTSSDNNIIFNYTSSSTTYDAIDFTFSNNNSLTFFSFSDCADGTQEECINVFESDNNIIKNGSIDLVTNAQSYAIQLWAVGTASTDSSYNNSFQDITITNIVGTDIRINDGGGSSEILNTTFINVTYDSELIDTNSELNRKWYYQAYVNDTSGSAISGAIVTPYNVSGTNDTILTTNSSGWTQKGVVTEYINLGGTKTFYTNYTINTTFQTSMDGNLNYNFTQTQNLINDVFTLNESEVWQCGTLDTQNQLYYQQKDISTGSTCFNITANNITLDMNGFNITDSSPSQSEYGVYSYGYNDSTIENGEIYEFGRGISLAYGYNWTITNISVLETTNFGSFTSAYGIYINQGTNYNITNVNVSARNTDGNGYGIYAHTLTNSVIENINSSNNYATFFGNPGAYAVYLTFASSNVLNNLFMQNNYGYGLYLINTNDNFSVSNTVSSFNARDGMNIDATNSNFTNSTLENNSNNAIYLQTGISSNILRNTVANNNFAGISLSGTNNQIINYSANSNGASALSIWSADSTSITNFTLFDCSPQGQGACIDVYDSDNNYFENGYLNYTSESEDFGIWMRYSGSSTTNTTFKDLLIENIANLSVFVDDNGVISHTNLTFLNVTYVNESVDANSELIRKWYYQTYVNSTNGSAVGSATVTAYNTSDVLIDAQTTNSSGWTPQSSIIEYVNDGGTTNYYNNYSLNATKTGYGTGTTKANVSLEKNKLNYVITLNQSLNITEVLAINDTGISGSGSSVNVIRGENVTINATIENATIIDKVWVKIWEGVTGTSNVLFQGFLSFITGDLWSIVVPTNWSFPLGIVNYTVYVNDTTGQEVNLSSDFNITQEAQCAIESITETANTSYQHVNGNTWFYYASNAARIGTMRVTATSTTNNPDTFTFPDTVSTGGSDNSDPYEFDYAWDESDTFNGTVTITMNDTYNNTATCTFDIYRDATSPSFDGANYYTGARYENGTDFWVTQNDNISFQINHSDGQSGVYRQYFGFNKDNCNPNGCGGAPYEIKSYTNVESLVDWMANDSYINIYSTSCVLASCYDAPSASRIWNATFASSLEWNYKVRVYLYDFVGRGIGYSDPGFWVRIDNTAPISNATSNVSATAANFNVTFVDNDNRSGVATCYYRIYDGSDYTLNWTSRTCNTTIEIDTSTYCQDSQNCTVSSIATDNVDKNSTENTTIVYFDATNPTLTIIDPLNDSKYNTTTVNFNISISEAASWCGLSLDGATNISMSSINSTYYTYQNTSMTQTDHTVIFYCNDSSSNIGTSNTHEFLVDTTIPFVAFDSSTTADAATVGSLFVNLTSSDTNDHYVVNNLDNSIIGWWRMDLIDGSGNPLDNSGLGNDGAKQGDARQVDNGRFGEGFTFDGTTDYISITHTNVHNVYANTSYTFSAWFKSTDTSAVQMGILDKKGGSYTASTVPGYALFWDNDNDLRLQLTDNNQAQSSISYDNVSIVDGRWHLATAVINRESNNASLYLDGVYRAGDSDISDVGDLNNSYALQINDADNWASNATLDEVILFNRSLSDAEIASLYNAQVNQYEETFNNLASGSHTFQGIAVDEGGNINQTESRSITIDATNPTLTVVEPVSNALFNTTIVNFNVSIDETTSWCGLSLDGATNITMSSINSTYFTYSNTSMTDANHSYIIFCNDSYGNLGQSTTRYVLVDTTQPFVAFDATSTPNGATQQSLFVNITSSDTNDHYVVTNIDNNLVSWYRMDILNSTGAVMDESGNQKNGIPAGNAKQVDNGAFGEAFTFDGDNDYIDLGDTGILLNDTFSYSMWVNVKNRVATYYGAIIAQDYMQYGTALQNMEGSGVYVDNIASSFGFGVAIYGTENQSLRARTDNISYNTWYHVVATKNNTDLCIYLNGSLEECQSVSFVMRPDTEGTLMIGNNPEGATLAHDFNGSIDEVMVFNRTLTLAEIQALYNASANQYERNFTALSSGTHTYQGFAVDKGGNINNTESRSMTIPSPAITVIDPANDSKYNTTTVNFNISISEAVQWCGLSLDGATNISMSSINSTYYTYQNTSMTQMSHTLVFYCNDSYGNLGNSSTHILLIDTTIPYLDFDTSTTANSTTASSLFINITSSDTNDHYVINNLDNSIVGWWRMDILNATGAVIDESGFGHNGLPQGNAKQVDNGRFGEGFTFDGNGDSININHSSTLEMNENITVSGWIKANSFANTPMLLGYNNNADTNTLLFGFSTTGLMGLWMGVTSVTSLYSLPTSKWTHLTWVFDNSGDKVYYYVNGQLNDSDTLTATVSYSNGGWYIGAECDSAPCPDGNYFNGSIDEVIIFNRSLSATEIASLYNATANQYEETFSSVSEGTHTFQGFAVDEAGNINNTESRSMTLDQTASLINFISPTNSSGSSTNDTSYEVNVSIQEQYLQDVVYHWDGTNFTLFNNSVIAMYNFDNRSSLDENDTLVVDISGNGNNATVNNADLVTGRYSNGFMFDATAADNDRITISSSSLLDNLNNTGMTLATWVYFNGTYGESTVNMIFNKGGTTSDPVGSWWFAVTNTGYPQFSKDYATTDLLTRGDTIVPADSWNHLVLTWDGGNDSSADVAIYINGVAQSHTTDQDGDGSIVSDAGIDLYLGNSIYNNRAINATLDDVIILNRSLSASEINQLYMTNLYKFNATQWYLYVNQTTNATAGLEDGTYTYQVFVNDTANNDNSTESRTITIDTTAPIITNINASNETGVLADTTSGGTVTRNDTVTINATVTGSPQAVWVKIWEGAIGTSTVLFQGLLSLISGDLWGIIVQTNFSFPVGTINYTIFANDSTGNVATNVSGNFTIIEQTGVTGCQTLDQANTVYTMQNDIITDSTCFNITANNVILDMNGFNITGDYSGTDYGVYVNGYDNFTLKNGAIYLFRGYGLFMTSSNMNNITNMTINNNGYYIDGIYLSSSSNNHLSRINLSGNHLYGIRLESNSNNNILEDINSSYNYYGLSIISGTNNTLSEIITNGNTGNGISITDSYNTLSNSITNFNLQSGLYIGSYNTFANITVHSNEYTGINIAGDSNIITNFSIYNCSSAGQAACMYVSESDNNTFTNGYINYTSEAEDYGIWIQAQGTASTDVSDNNTFTDIIIENIAGTNIRIDDGGGSSAISNNTFINVTYVNESVDANSELIRKWYYQAYVNYSNSTAVADASVIAYNTSDATIESLTTNASGWTQKGTIIDYVNLGGTRNYYSNYTINATKGSRFDSNIQNVTQTQNFVNDVFTLDATNPTLTIIDPANDSKYNTTTVDFNISISEAASWCGLSLDGATNISMSSINSTYYTYQNTSMTQTDHTVIFYCNDSSSNIGTSNTHEFLVDTTLPFIAFDATTTADSATAPNLFVNITSSDTNDHYVVNNLDNSIVGWWRMDVINSTNAVMDESGNGLDGLPQGNARHVDNGRFGEGYSFDASGSDYIRVVDNDLLDISENLSISLWLKADVEHDGFAVHPLEKWSSTNNANFVLYYFGNTTGSNRRVGFYANRSNTWGNIGTTYAPGIELNTWYHIGLTYSATNGGQLYINGAPYGSLIGSGTLQTNTLNLQIGQSFDGSIDDVMIFNRTISDVEMASLFNATANKYEENFTTLTSGTHQFQGFAVDEGGNINQTESRSMTINTQPLTPTPQINSTDGSNKTAANLNCFDTLTDPEGDALNVSVRWYKNAVLDQTIDYNNTYANGTAFSATLVATNTTKADNWSCSLRVYDGFFFSSWSSNSENLTIVNTAPVVTILSPDLIEITNRTVEHNWSCTDADSDTCTNFTININATYLGIGNPCSDETISNTTYTKYIKFGTCLKDNGYQYDWSVRAYDGEEWGSYDNATYNITALISVTFTTDTVNFGTLDPFGAPNDTTDNNPQPFVLQNTGNVLVNISHNASQLFVEKPTESDFYQIKIDNKSGEEGAFTWLTSITNWINVSLTGHVFLIDSFNFSDANDELEVDIKLEVPDSETPGVKSSTLVLNVTMAE